MCVTCLIHLTDNKSQLKNDLLKTLYRTYAWSKKGKGAIKEERTVEKQRNVENARKVLNQKRTTIEKQNAQKRER